VLSMFTQAQVCRPNFYEQIRTVQAKVVINF